MVIIIVIQVFSILILPLLNETIVCSRKTTTLVSIMALCIEAVIDMEDMCPLNVD